MINKLVAQMVDSKNTPAYVFDIDKLVDKVKAIRSYLPNIKLCYAIKANPFLIKELDEYVDVFEVCSPGELLICKELEIDMKKVVLSGVNKEEADIDDAMRFGVTTFTIESLIHANILQKCAEKNNINIDVLPRLTSGNQFGIDFDVIKDIIKDDKYTNLKVKGIHYYSGTQKNPKKIQEEIEMLEDVCKEVEDMCGSCFLEYGPGFSVEYFKVTMDENQPLADCADVINSECKLRPVTLEMGRFLTSHCGMYFTKVVDIKENQGQKYCIVDGGINHVNYYGQVMGAKMPPVTHYVLKGQEYVEETRPESGDEIIICGSLCTTADVIARKFPVEKLSVGDVFVFDKIGAYSVTEGIYLFLSRKMPRIFTLKNSKLTMLRDFVQTYKINCIENK